MSVIDTRVATLDIPATAPEVITSLKSYNNQQVPMKPQLIRAEWRRRDGGDWQLCELVVHGVRIKKDGSMGMNGAESQFYWCNRQVQPLPSWVSTAINSVQPSDTSGGA